MGKYTFHEHPFKDQILQMWEDGKNPYHVDLFLKEKGEEYTLSKPTLYKHYNSFKRANKDRTTEKNKTQNAEFIRKIEAELWETINACGKRLKDKTLTPKDWQYYDQQKQSAIEKLIKLKELKGTSDDPSLILSRFFAKFMSEQKVTDTETPTQEIDGKQAEEQIGGTEDIVPGATLPV